MLRRCCEHILASLAYEPTRAPFDCFLDGQKVRGVDGLACYLMLSSRAKKVCGPSISARASATCGKCLQACQDSSLCAQVQARAQRHHGSEAQSPPRPCADSAEQTGAAFVGTTCLGSSVSGASTSHIVARMNIMCFI